MKKQMSFKWIFAIMLLSLVIASLWDKWAWIKNSVHYALNPSAGALLNWNLWLGMAIVVLVITIITTLIQKYTTDQKALKELRDEQKKIQKEIKENKNNPQKVMELQKKNMGAIPKQFKLSMVSIAYTGIPFILLFRWFNDYFVANGNIKLFGFLGWFWFYLIASIIFSSLLKKWMKVV
jgi:uncharacterized membrane protein (DUF106 family)